MLQKPRHDANVVNEGSRGGGSQPSIRGSGVISERAKGEIQARGTSELAKGVPRPPSHLFPDSRSQQAEKKVDFYHLYLFWEPTKKWRRG